LSREVPVPVPVPVLPVLPVPVPPEPAPLVPPVPLLPLLPPVPLLPLAPLPVPLAPLVSLSLGGLPLPIDPLDPLLPAAPLAPLEVLSFLCFLSFLCLGSAWLEPVVALLELPELWSLICEPLAPLCCSVLLVAAAGSVPVRPAVLLDCACTVSPLNIAATTDAPNRPFKSLFVFMSFLLLV
jgi:hypothetical protein